MKVDGQLVTKTSVCNDKSVVLSAIKNNDWNYQWKKDGKNIEGAKSPELSVSETGDYQLVTSLAGSCSKTSRSSVVTVQVTEPSFDLKSNGEPVICATSGRLTLYAIKNTVYTYEWFKDNSRLSNNADSLLVKEPGKYWAIVNDNANGCKSLSDTVNVESVPGSDVTPTIVPVDPICGTSGKAISISATPAGGTFTGPGVEGDNFNPQKAGLGTHEIVYSVGGSSTCGNSDKIEIIVYPLPVSDAGNDIFVQTGGSGLIGTSPVDNLVYAWQPPTGLDAPNRSVTQVTPLHNTEYVLTVTDENGCTNQDNVVVNISNKVLIPDAFSPDGDGINETWELHGVASYPDIEVTVFDRWGSVIFYSKGYLTAFDGKYKEQLLPPGTYPYIIKLDPTKQHITGSLILIR